MRNSTLLFLALLALPLFIFLSCSDDDPIDIEIEEPIIEQPSEVDLSNSPFLSFLGEWKLEYRILNGDTITTENLTMTIEEDDDVSDTLAKGIYSDEDMTVQLTDIDSQIILKMSSYSLICTYAFIDDASFELDDSNDFYTEISKWTKL